MSPTSLAETARAVERSCRRVAAAAAAPAIGLAILDWLVVHELGRAEGLTLAACAIALALLAGVGATLRRPYWDHAALEGDRDAATREGGDAEAMLDGVLAVPRRMQWIGFGVSALVLAILPFVMSAAGFTGWLSLARLASAAGIALASAALGSLLVFHLAQRAVSPLVAEVAREVDAGATGVRPVRSPLRRKLTPAIVVPSACALVLCFDAFGAHVRATEQARAADWASAALDAVARADAALPLSARVATTLPSEDLRAFPVRIVELDADGDGAEATDEIAAATITELDAAIDGGAAAGRLGGASAPDVIVYRRIGTGAVLLASVDAAALSGMASGLPVGLAVIGLVLIGGALVLARATASELGRGVVAIEGALEGILAGDLSARVDWASDDELGRVAASMHRVGAGLRETVERVSKTAECAEGAVVEAASALSDLRACGASQVELLQHVDQMMAMVGARVGEASQAATELSATIEESSSSLLELGAAGDELNQTAGVLTSKVDAVSDSLDQIVRSGKQIAGTTEKLSSASEDTSSSMEEMAAAMRAVDISAEATAQLSRDVVGKAEEGQAKVVQTIEGMDAIREATEIAEHVIRGLGQRTQEIGGILDVIDDVTDETNLLALNAAIIAAQAGEHGRAFSVVADEIKELADRVVTSTTEIAGLIRSLQTESENAIGAIEAGSKSVMSGVDLSAEAGRTLEAITIASRESGTRIADIVSAVREQTNAATHVVQLMERVRESTDEIGTASTEQDQGNEVVAQSTQAMREVALLVRRTTEEQARGLGRIRENVVGVKEAVEQITGSLGDQSSACRDVAESLGRAAKDAQANDEAAGRLENVIRDLESRAAELREEVARFRVS